MSFSLRILRCVRKIVGAPRHIFIVLKLRRASELETNTGIVPEATVVMLFSSIQPDGWPKHRIGRAKDNAQAHSLVRRSGIFRQEYCASAD